MIKASQFIWCYVTQGGGRGFLKFVTRRYMGGRGSEIRKTTVT